MADHDQRFKVLIREFFREFIELFFPSWAERFDLDHIDWLTQEVFLDPPQGERRYADLLAQVPVRKGVQTHSDVPLAWLVLVHIEVEWRDGVAQLRPRFFEYYRQLRTRQGFPVLPIGLYLRVGLNGIGWDTYEEWFWEHRLIHFEFPYVGLPALEALEYLESGNVLGIALAALMRIPEDRRGWLKAESLERLSRSQQSDQRRYLLCECVEAYLPLEGPQLAEYEHLLMTEPYKGARMMGVTSYEKGLHQGLHQGRQEGQRALVERLLSKRFGPLPAQVLERLGTMSEERVLEIAELILTAASLQELRLPD